MSSRRLFLQYYDSSAMRNFDDFEVGVLITPLDKSETGPF